MQNSSFWRVATRDNQRLNIKIPFNKFQQATFVLNDYTFGSRQCKAQGTIQQGKIDELIKQLIGTPSTESVRFSGWQYVYIRKANIARVEVRNRDKITGSIIKQELGSLTCEEAENKVRLMTERFSQKSNEIIELFKKVAEHTMIA